MLRDLQCSDVVRYSIPVHRSDRTGGDNAPPVANEDVAQTMEDVPVTGNVLNNDVEPDGDNIILNHHTGPRPGEWHGSTECGWQFYLYTESWLYGMDTFCYEICDDANAEFM